MSRTVEYLGLVFCFFRKYHKFKCSCGRIWCASAEYDKNVCISEFELHDKFQ